MLSKDIVVNIVYKEQKKDYCTGSDCILIDDLETNINELRKLGGTGILHKNAKDTINELKKLNILKMKTNFQEKKRSKIRFDLFFYINLKSLL